MVLLGSFNAKHSINTADARQLVNSLWLNNICIRDIA